MTPLCEGHSERAALRMAKQARFGIPKSAQFWAICEAVARCQPRDSQAR